jgi:pyruvate dehydrogenase E1 component beta subunit
MTVALKQLSFLQAIGEAQREEMRRDDKIFLMGQDIRANVYGAITGFIEEFGEDRVRNVPLSEAGFVGAAVGAAMVGMRPIVDITIAPFFYVAMDQIVSMAAKATYMYGGQTKVPLVLRSTMFYAGGLAAQHSDRPYPIFMTVPGLKIMIPSNPYDAKGLLKTAIRDDNPVMTFEDGLLWGAKSEIPDEEYLIPFGEAKVVREGSDVTIVALGSRVQMAVTAAEAAAKEGISVEVIDPRTLVPLDKEAILKSVAKTGRLITVEVAHKTCGAGAEIAGIVAEEGFWDLKAPIKRLAVPDVHIPFSPPLEPQFYPDVAKITAAIKAVME